MTFVSLEFLALLAIVYPLYWSMGRRAQNLLLLAANCVFYAWWNWRYLPLIVLSASADYAAGIALTSVRTPWKRRAILASALLFNIGILGYFKYAQFLVDTTDSIRGALGFPSGPHPLDILLPIGISFHTFQSMGYSIDVYRGRLSPTRNFLDFVSFVTFFPQLVAGPIERAERLLVQFHHPRAFDLEVAKDGLRRILWGYFKKLVVADNISQFVKGTYGDIPGADGGSIAAATILFSIQLYCDFSAYSDIGTGTAQLLGFNLMRNFAYPFFARDSAELWRRWHISLTSWFRDYLYYPLGGSRVAPWRRTLNVLFVFLVSGLWHGANWTFVLWGGFVGVCVVLQGGRARAEDPLFPGRLLPSFADTLRMLSTFLLFSVSMVMFVSPDVATMAEAYRRILLDWNTAGAWRMLSPHLPAIAVLFACEWIQRDHLHPLHVERLRPVLRWCIYAAFCIAILMFGALNYSEPFIYFQF